MASELWQIHTGPYPQVGAIKRLSARLKKWTLTLNQRPKILLIFDQNISELSDDSVGGNLPESHECMSHMEVLLSRSRPLQLSTSSSSILGNGATDRQLRSAIDPPVPVNERSELPSEAVKIVRQSMTAFD